MQVDLQEPDPVFHCQWQKQSYGKWRVLPPQFQRKMETRLQQDRIERSNALVWHEIKWWDHDEDEQKVTWYVANLATMRVHRNTTNGYWCRLRRLCWWSDEHPPPGHIQMRGSWCWLWNIPGERHIGYW